MPAPFAALEASVNDAVIDNLANRVMTIDDVQVSGVYTEDYAEIGLVESYNPVFIVKTSDLPEFLEHGMKVESDDLSRYEIVGIKPDGNGLTALELKVEWLT